MGLLADKSQKTSSFTVFSYSLNQTIQDFGSQEAPLGKTVQDFGPLEAQDARSNRTVHDFGPLEAQRAPEIFRF